MHLPWRRVEFASEKCQRRRACLTLSRAICFRSKTPPKMTSVHPCWLKDLCFQGCWVTWHGKDYVVPALPSRKILCKGESAIKAFMTHACFAWCSLPLIWRIHQNAPCLFLSPPPPLLALNSTMSLGCRLHSQVFEVPCAVFPIC